MPPACCSAGLRWGVPMKWRSAGDSYWQATLFGFLLITAFAGRSPVLILACLLAAALLVALNLGVFARASVRERNAAILFALVLTAVLPLSILRGETAIIHYVVAMTSMGAALVLTRNLDVYLKASQLALLASQLYVLAYLSRTGVLGFPLEDMLPDSSSNGVTSYLILLQANYCLIRYLITRRAALITSAITLFICFVGWGRGSILAAAILMTIGIFSTVSSRNTLAMAARLLVLVCAGLIAYGLYSPAITKAVAATKIGAGLYDESRAGMIGEYVHKVDAFTLWSGAGYEGTSIANEYNANPHNSFIRAHHIFGLPYLLMVLLLPAHLVHRRLPTAIKVYAGCIWVVVVFRSFTEPVLFPTLFDYFYFSACFALSRAPMPAGGELRPAG